MKRDIVVIVTGLALLTAGLVFAVKISAFDLGAPPYATRGDLR